MLDRLAPGTGRTAGYSSRPLRTRGRSQFRGGGHARRLLGEMVEPAVFSALCVASLGLYPHFAAEIEESSGHGIGYRSDGSLLVALDEKLEEELAEVYQRQTSQGFLLQPLTATEVHAHSAGLSPQIRSGLFVPGDHWVDNERLMRALVITCQRAGVHLEAGHAVRKIHIQGGHITRVIAGNYSSFTAKTYVLAAGSWSGEIATGLGLHVPITPCGGQLMEFEAPRELPFVVRAGIHYLVPRSERRSLVGTTAEYTGFEKAVTAKGLHSILEGFRDCASLLRTLCKATKVPTAATTMQINSPPKPRDRISQEGLRRFSLEPATGLPA